jgi:hypothetical protein
MNQFLKPKNNLSLLVSTRDFFSEMVTSAIDQRRLDSKPTIRKYLTDLLEFYMVSENLFEEANHTGRTETMAERLLKAVNMGGPTKQEELKRLGDTALYVSGFFGDSFKRKVIDIDYYVEIGGTAYGALASSDQAHIYTNVYEDLANRFVDYVDVLTVISQKSLIQNNEDLLRLYDRYIVTGSKLAEEQLQQEGMLNAAIRKNGPQ